MQKLLKNHPVLHGMVKFLIAIFYSILNCFFNFFLISFHKKFQKHLGGIIHRVRIIKLIIQFNLRHDGPPLCFFLFYNTYYAHTTSVSTVKLNFIPFLIYFILHTRHNWSGVFFVFIFFIICIFILAVVCRC